MLRRKSVYAFSSTSAVLSVFFSVSTVRREDCSDDLCWRGETEVTCARVSLRLVYAQDGDDREVWGR